jgi:YaiO family outer membrane protein
LLATHTSLHRDADPGVCRPRRPRLTLAAGVIAGLAVCAPSHVYAQPAPDQASEIRSLVSAGQFDRAITVVDAWMARYPDDLDARAWHARLLAWTNRWAEAESAYRELLAHAPDDVDLLAGLADVLHWQRRGEEALPLLDRACALDSQRADTRLRRAQVLEQLGRPGEARAAYAEVLTRDPASADAQKGLVRLRPPARYEVRFGSDLDRIEETTTNSAVAVSFGARWNEKWNSVASLSQYQRYGEGATRVGVEVSRRFRGGDQLTISEVVAPGQSIVPLQDLQVEYGRRIRRELKQPLGGVEASVQQRWMSYQDATVLSLTPGVICYLPRDWIWLLRLSANWIHIRGTGSEWRASGWTRLTIPLHGTLDTFVLAAIGTEDYGYRDQIRGFTAETVGAGLRWRMAAGQEISGHGQYQWRSNGQAQVSVGASYGIRF